MEEMFGEEIYNAALLPIDVTLTDDHPLMREGIASSLASKSRRIKVLGTASSYDTFFELLKEAGEPDVALLDVIMPGKSGIDIARRLRIENPDVRILMLSSDNSELTVMQAVNVGINGFISKSSSPADLVSAVETIADGGSYFGSDIARIIESFEFDRNPDRKQFTIRELEIMDLCCDGLTSREIAQKLNISIRTVETHKNNIFKAMNINSTTEMVKLALEKHLIQI